MHRSEFSIAKAKNPLQAAAATFGLFAILCGFSAGRAAAQGTTAPGTPAVTFQLVIDGVPVKDVLSEEIIGPETEVEFLSTNNNATRTRPGNHKPGKITVSKDWSNTSEWYKWRKAVLDGKVERKSVSIIFLNDAGEEAGRMNFFHCWPTKWNGPALNAKSSGHAAEKLEIVFETMEMK